MSKGGLNANAAASCAFCTLVHSPSVGCIDALLAHHREFYGVGTPDADEPSASSVINSGSREGISRSGSNNGSGRVSTPGLARSGPVRFPRCTGCGFDICSIFPALNAHLSTGDDDDS